MLWENPSKTHSGQINVKKYIIRPGSALSVPKRVLAGVQNFEIALDDYLRKQANDVDLMLGMIPIYNIYKTEGVVDIQSTESKILKQRHERVIVNFLRENVQYIARLHSSMLS